jgi:toxin secretion/phage lysis holin
MEEVSLKIAFNIFLLGIANFMYTIGMDIEATYYLSILLIIDYVTGLLKAKTLGQSITSNKMKYGIVSKLSIVAIPLVLSIGAKAIGMDFHQFLTVAINLIILSEIYSIIGNVYSIREGKELPEYDALSFIASRIRDFLEKNSGK